MYEFYWGIDSSPFQNVPDPKLYYPSSQHEEALTRLLYAVKGRKGAAMLTGEVGAGKTTLSRMLIGQLAGGPYNVGVINNPALPLIEFIREIHYQLGVPEDGSKKPTKLELLRRFNDYLYENLRNGVDTVLIVDEAQLIKDMAIFEELRLLLNFQLNDRFLLTLVLMGQPELKNSIARIRQLGQRIAVRYHLGPFDLVETARYITFRMKAAGGRDDIFTDKAVVAVHEIAGGMPREINNISDLALLAGFARKSEKVTAEIVRAVADEGRIKEVQRSLEMWTL